ATGAACTGGFALEVAGAGGDAFTTPAAAFLASSACLLISACRGKGSVSTGDTLFLESLLAPTLCALSSWRAGEREAKKKKKKKLGAFCSEPFSSEPKVSCAPSAPPSSLPRKRTCSPSPGGSQ